MTSSLIDTLSVTVRSSVRPAFIPWPAWECFAPGRPEAAAVRL